MKIKKYSYLFFAIGLSLFSIHYSQAQSKPNIIYILADDLGYGDLSALNKNSKIQTTHLDEMAKSGMKFSDAHSSSAVCTPTRYGILTGRYNWRTELQDGVTWSYSKPLIKKDEPTVATLLKTQGYQTACIGKWHLGLGWQYNAKGDVDFFKPILNGPITNGFDYFYGITASLDIPPYFYIENDKITAKRVDTIKGTSGKGFWREGPIGDDFKHIEVLPKITEKATTYIKQQAKAAQPFFLYFPLPAPHTPILPTAEFLGKSGTTAYGDFVLMVDDVVGQIRKAVKDAGIEENTLIIFTSDNGCSPAANLKELATFGHNPNYEFRGHKADIYDGGHRVPFIASWPSKIQANTITKSTICLTDLTATVAAITNTKLADNSGVDSYSLMPLFTQSKKEKYLRNYTIHHSVEGAFAIRQGKWKLEVCAGSGGWSKPTPSEVAKQNLPSMQLYNLDKDIGEKNNVIAKYPKIVKKLMAQLKQCIADGRSTAGSVQKNDVIIDLIKKDKHL